MTSQYRYCYAMHPLHSLSLFVMIMLTMARLKLCWMMTTTMTRRVTTSDAATLWRVTVTSWPTVDDDVAMVTSMMKARAMYHCVLLLSVSMRRLRDRQLLHFGPDSLQLPVSMT